MAQRWCVTMALAGLLLACVATAARAQTQAPATGPAVDELTVVPPPTLGQRIGEAWTWFKIKWQVGGATMWFIGFAGLLAVASAIDRGISLRRNRIVPKGLATEVNRLWEQGQYAQVIRVADASDSTLGRVVAFIAEHRNNPYDLVNKAAEDIAARDFEIHSRRNYPLAAVGTIAPLLGLLGTVSGLLGAFATIGVVGSMDNPADLAGDIGEALITTFAGLWVAIPALFAYHIFRSRTGQFASVLGEEVSGLMHRWFLKKEAGDARQV